MPKVIAILNQKGGVGKTTLAVHIATALARKSRSVLLLDADPQGSALDWAAARHGEPLFPVVGLTGVCTCPFVAMNQPPGSVQRQALFAQQLREVIQGSLGTLAHQPQPSRIKIQPPRGHSHPVFPKT